MVIKMVRRFELAPAKKKPQVPKKPARLVGQWKADTSASSADSAGDCAEPKPDRATHRCEPDSDATGWHSRGVSRADSVNDHGYFTLEKRKPAVQRMSSAPPLVTVGDTPHRQTAAVSVDCAGDDMDLRHNFEEFHLDSLEEEEHFYELTARDKDATAQSDEAALLAVDTPSLSLTDSPIRSPAADFADDRSSGDGAEWSQSYDAPQTPPPSAQSTADCTSLSISSSCVQLLPQLGDATPTAVQFDRFLDVSGLTQKSILTPSRLLSNHKNMLKPKDVKHRSKVKAVLGSCRLNDDVAIHHHSANQVRYYVEPFL